MARPVLSLVLSTALTVVYFLHVEVWASSEPSQSWSSEYNLELVDLQWGEWSSCSRTCGLGSQTRHRVCHPRMDDRTCDQLISFRNERADFTETRSCKEEECFAGLDVDWGEWSQCSRTCGGGIRVRRLACRDPSIDRQTCRHLMSTLDRRNLIERQPCNEMSCKGPYRGHWGPWHEWEPCSSTCGPSTSFQVRYRTCLVETRAPNAWSSSSVETSMVESSNFIPVEYCETRTDLEIRPCDHLQPCPQPGDNSDTPTNDANVPSSYSSFVSVDDYEEESPSATESTSWAES